MSHINSLGDTYSRKMADVCVCVCVCAFFEGKKWVWPSGVGGSRAQLVKPVARGSLAETLIYSARTHAGRASKAKLQQTCVIYKGKLIIFHAP